MTAHARARGGGGGSSGSRSGSRGSTTSRSGSSYRYSSGIRSIASRFTSSSGFSNSNRFSVSPSTGLYRYGSYSGSRFGTSIRRTSYWPVAAILYGYPYRSVYRRPLSNSANSIENQVLISDQYFKKESDNDTTLYYCVNGLNSIVETCYESIEINSTALSNPTEISENDEGFSISDGSCCEDRNSKQPVCCIIQINRAFALKGIMLTLGSLVLTSTILALKICR